MKPKIKKAYPPLNVYRKIAYFFIAIAFILLIVIFYYTIQYTSINITPTEETVTTDFNFVVYQSDSNQLEDQSDRGIFSGLVISNQYDSQKMFNATGEKEVPVSDKNIVIIKNNYNVDQPLVKTTRLLTTDKVLFRINDSVNVPANGSVEVEAYPDDENQDVNIGFQEFTIPGLAESMQKLIYAQTSKGFGLEQGEVKVVTEDDINKAIEELKTELVSENKVSSDLELMETIDIVSQEIDKNPGEVADSFMVNISLLQKGVAFDLNKIKLYATKRLEATLLPSQNLKSIDLENLDIQIKEIDLENNLVELAGTVKGVAILRSDAKILDKQSLVGMNESEVKEYLENFETIETADVKFFPFWLKHVPDIVDHINIEVFY